MKAGLVERPLWRPSEARIAAAELTRFAARQGYAPRDYLRLWRWSIEAPGAFWQSVWDHVGVRAQNLAETSLTGDGSLRGARWFPGARLNFAENLLRPCDDEAPALIVCDEGGRRRVWSRPQLRTQVARLALSMRNDGIGVGDRVAGFVPNGAEAVIAMLAAASLGAIWTSCSPDFGEAGVLDRFGQTEPKILFACDGYRYNGRAIDTRERAAHIVAALPSVRKLVVFPFLDEAPNLDGLGKAVAWQDYLSDAAEPAFVPLPFDHPLFVLYSSGTTGTPKGIVHGAGGTLLQHLKEHRLHGDLRPGDRLFFFTTCGWMMWNWQVSALATGATLVLYDGSPLWPRADALWDLVARERVTHFGVSPKFLSAVEKAAYRPRDQLDLGSLRTLYSTGSPLAPEQFDFVYDAVASDLQLASISGGTDIISCFALGNAWSPVWRGELQGPGLGMAVDVVDEHGQPLHGLAGELVCRQPFPSMPLGFWNDADGSRYEAAYFARFPGLWHHGDFARLSEHGGLEITGRSDATLNPGGVRIGTGEIYRIVDAQPEILESVAVGYAPDGDERMLLFVRLREGLVLDAALIQRLRQAIRSAATPRHVPAKILSCPEVPRTISGKITELAVREALHGRPVRNTEAMANPQALAYFRGLTAEQLATAEA